jgi:predicted naringenin-chalcone synthase
VAARRVVAQHRVDPAAVDCIITSTATHDAIPGMDAHLVRSLGLRPDVSRRPMTQLGCAGGAHGIIMAADYVRARPGSIVMVVLGDSLSSMHHHTDISIEAFIYKALWTDSGTAVLVSDRPLGPGLEVVDTWEYLLPDTLDRYRTRIDREGLHFDSLPTATKSVRDVAPPLRAWLAQPLPGHNAPARGGAAQADGSGGSWPLDFIVAHTGGPAILRDLAIELNVDEKLLRHSWESLDKGNLGGGSVLDVLDRTYATPPADGDTGLLIGFGPGFAVSAAKVVRRGRV